MQKERETMQTNKIKQPVIFYLPKTVLQKSKKDDIFRQGKVRGVYHIKYVFLRNTKGEFFDLNRRTLNNKTKVQISEG